MNLLEILKQKYKTHKLMVKLNKVEKFDDVFNILVPPEGKADTILGEIDRAIEKIRYRWYNDGDVFFIGYGKETCGGDAHYLSTCAIEGIRNLFPSDDPYDLPTNRKSYEKFLDNLTKEFMKVLKDKKLVKELLKHNDVDSRELDSKFSYNDYEDIAEVYIIANTDNGATLMNDDTFEENWRECCENAYEVRMFDSEREAYNYIERHFRYINGDIEKENPIYKDLDVEKMYYSELGNGLLSESESELMDDMDTMLLKDLFN